MFASTILKMTPFALSTPRYSWHLFVTYRDCAALLGFGVSRGIFPLMLAIGCVADAEVLAITFISRHPPIDVPSIVHAIRVRQRDAMRFQPA